MNEKTISHNQAHAIFLALANANLWQVCTIEFPEMVEVVTRSMQQPTKRVVVIGHGEHITAIDQEWLDTLQSNDDEYAEERRQQLLDDVDSYDQAWW